MPTIQPPTEIDEFLTEHNFKKNGYDYYKNYPITDLTETWEEEVYVSLTTQWYEIFYPEQPKKDRTFKTAVGMKRYIVNNHS